MAQFFRPARALLNLNGAPFIQQVNAYLPAASQHNEQPCPAILHAQDPFIDADKILAI